MSEKEDVAKCPVFTSPTDKARIVAVESDRLDRCLSSWSFTRPMDLSGPLRSTMLFLPSPTIDAALTIDEWGRVETISILETPAL